MERRRVVVTGLGVVSPIGVGVAPFWSNLVNGVSGIAPITKFDAAPFATQIAGEVKDFDASKHISRCDLVRTDRNIHYALTAAQEAAARITRRGVRSSGDYVNSGEGRARGRGVCSA